MKVISADAVWELRRDSARRTLLSSQHMATALADLASGAGLGSAAVSLAINDVNVGVKQQRETLDELSTDSLGSLAWTTLRQATTATTAMQSRHISLLQGALLRDIEVVRVRATAAQRYLAELGRLCGMPWSGLVVPGVTDEHERHHGSVSFAFSSADFWDMPILAHEFGHVVEGSHRKTGVDHVEQILDLQNLVNATAERYKRPPSVVREYLSDAFAVYVGGPAFVAALLLLRLDPTARATSDPGGTHPSDPRRALAACDALANLDGETFVVLADRFREMWSGMRSAAGVDDADVGASKDLELARSMWPRLRAFEPARFTSSRRASAAELAACLGGGTLPVTSIGDLLVAGWQRRLELLMAGKDVGPTLGDELLNEIAQAGSTSDSMATGVT